MNSIADVPLQSHLAQEEIDEFKKNQVPACKGELVLIAHYYTDDAIQELAEETEVVLTRNG